MVEKKKKEMSSKPSDFESLINSLTKSRLQIPAFLLHDFQ
jgi:hypothetical protein